MGDFVLEATASRNPVRCSSVAICADGRETMEAPLRRKTRPAANGSALLSSSPVGVVWIVVSSDGVAHLRERGRLRFGASARGRSRPKARWPQARATRAPT